MIVKADLVPFIPTNKLKAEDAPEDVLVAANSIVLSALRTAGYNVTDWNTSSATPVLVRTITAMYAAGVYYSTTFSEVDATEAAYGVRLKSDALALLQSLIDGELALEDEFAPVVTVQGGYFETFPIFEIDRVF